MDDYEEGRRSARTSRSEILIVDGIKMADLLEVTLTRIVDWPLKLGLGKIRHWAIRGRKILRENNLNLRSTIIHVSTQVDKVPKIDKTSNRISTECGEIP